MPGCMLCVSQHPSTIALWQWDGVLGSEKDGWETSLGPFFLSSCQIEASVTLRLGNTVQKIAGMYGSSLTVLDGLRTIMLESISLCPSSFPPFLPFSFSSFLLSFSYTWVIMF